MKPRPIPRLSESTQATFWTRVQRGSRDECWPWMAHRNAADYGQFHGPTGVLYAHRVAYALERGPIPDGLTLDHTCASKCCNPWHMEAVSQSTNIKRYWDKQTPICACGNPSRGKTGRCRACYNQ